MTDKSDLLRRSKRKKFYLNVAAMLSANSERKRNQHISSIRATTDYQSAAINEQSTTTTAASATTTMTIHRVNSQLKKRRKRRRKSMKIEKETIENLQKFDSKNLKMNNKSLSRLMNNKLSSPIIGSIEIAPTISSIIAKLAKENNDMKCLIKPNAETISTTSSTTTTSTNSSSISPIISSSPNHQINHSSETNPIISQPSLVNDHHSSVNVSVVSSYIESFLHVNKVDKRSKKITKKSISKKTSVSMVLLNYRNS